MKKINIKITGQDLYKQYEDTKNKLESIEKKISKRLDMIYNSRPDLFEEEDLNYYHNCKLSNYIYSKLDLIIQIENKYVNQSDQKNLFSD